MLRSLSKIYEIVVFTASQQAYADRIVDYLDIEKKLIHHRLYRQHCIEYGENMYIKDLRVLQRDLRHVIIVDNAPYAFAAQLDNGYPIIPFYDYKEDDEMAVLTHYLLQIQGYDDIRSENIRKFKLRELSEYSIGKYIQFYMPGNSDISSGEISSGGLIDGAPRISKAINSELNMIQRGLSTYLAPKKA
jgi:CTD small phosphatase-like protein 2